MFSMKKIMAIASACAATVMIAACGSTNNANDVKEISFQTWNLKNEKYTPYFTNLIKEFESENPQVKVKWIDQPADGYSDKLNADAAAGTLPDIIDMSPNMAYGLAKAGVLANLSEEDPDAAQQFGQAAWTAVTFSGKNLKKGAYAYPWYLNSGVQYYNKKVLENCGVNTIPTSMNEWFEAAHMIGKKCPGTSMLASTPTIESLGSYGVKLMNEDQTKFVFNSEKAAQLIQHFVDMYKEKSLSTESLNNQWTGEGEAFKRGTVASLAGSAYAVSDLEQNAPEVYKHLQISESLIGENGKRNVAMETLVLSKKAKHKEIAMKFAKFVTNAKNQTEFCMKSHTFPSTRKAIDDPAFTSKSDSKQDAAVSFAAKAIRDDNWLASPASFSENAKTSLREQIALAILGKQTPQQALDKAVEVANRDLK